jgi:hypothetical protein
MNDPEKPWSIYDVVQWTFKRGAKGDIETWARSKEEAIETIEHHGFKNVDPTMVVQSSDKRCLADVLSQTKEKEGL